MAKYPLIARVPEIWRRLDLNNANVVAGLLGTVDNEYEHWNSFVEQYLTFLNVDLISDSLLPILAPLVGYTWRYDKTFLQNRDRIRAAIRYASYRGTTDCLEDLLRQHGGQWWKITDQASRLDCWNRQGGWNSPNGFVMDANKWHDGAYVLSVDNDLDFDGFLIDFHDVRPDGTVWYFNRQIQPSIGELELVGTQTLQGKGTSQSGDWQGLYLNWQQDGSPQTEVSHPISYLVSTNTPWQGQFLNFDDALKSVGCFHTKTTGVSVSQSTPWQGDYWNWNGTNNISQITSEAT